MLGLYEIRLPINTNIQPKDGNYRCIAVGLFFGIVSRRAPRLFSLSS
jgi:hypothetical protein